MARFENDLAMLVGSRICHDLISPIGAINNGLELLSMTGTAGGPEMTLIENSVGNASARIRFFRVAFGSSEGQDISPDETMSILADLYNRSRWSVMWHTTVAPPRFETQLAFLALLCVETGMPYGGTVTIEKLDDSWTVKGTAERLNVDPALWGLLAEQTSADTLRPAHVQFGLLPAVMKDSGRQMKSSVTECDIRISF